MCVSSYKSDADLSLEEIDLKMLNEQESVLYWFSKDLRIHDNQALHALSGAQSLNCVYIVDPEWFRHSLWQRPSISALRWQFTLESIQSLKRSLMRYGQRLTVLYGSPSVLIPWLVKRYRFDHLATSRHDGSYEQKILRGIANKLPQLKVTEYEQYTLFSEDELPFPVADLPKTFSQFRKLVEHLPLRSPLPSPGYLPAMVDMEPMEEELVPDWVPLSFSSLRFAGGEPEALRHLSEYFSGDAPSTYKERRNELSGWENSSKLSPWLNSGCLSVRQVRRALIDYEQNYVANESTHWLYVELLWREYFQFLHRKIGDQSFSFRGTRSTPPLTSFYPERFRKWCEGETPFKLVNACMKELRATGFLSNRGRQIVASCLVNELSVDWRYGAAWFEHCLIDYDMATNWGNWQYIAGVGVDPRGGRRFNLQKQTELYDPDGLYQKRWGAEEQVQLDTRDPADWPINPV